MDDCMVSERAVYAGLTATAVLSSANLILTW